MKDLPEKDIVAAIRRYLATLGEDVFFWKEHGGLVYDPEHHTIVGDDDLHHGEKA